MSLRGGASRTLMKSLLRLSAALFCTLLSGQLSIYVEELVLSSIAGDFDRVNLLLCTGSVLCNILYAVIHS